MVAGTPDHIICSNAKCLTKTLIKDIRFKVCRNCNQEIPAAIFDKAVVENAESSTTDGESRSVSGSEDVGHEKDAGTAYQTLIERLIDAKAKVANRQAMGIPMPAYMLSDVAQIEAEIKVADNSMPTRAEAVGRTAAAEANRRISHRAYPE